MGVWKIMNKRISELGFMYSYIANCSIADAIVIILKTNVGMEIVHNNECLLYEQQTANLYDIVEEINKTKIVEIEREKFSNEKISESLRVLGKIQRPTISKFNVLNSFGKLTIDQKIDFINDCIELLNADISCHNNGLFDKLRAESNNQLNEEQQEKLSIAKNIIDSKYKLSKVSIFGEAELCKEYKCEFNGEDRCQ